MAVAGGDNGHDDSGPEDDWTWLGRMVREARVRQWDKIAYESDAAEARERLELMRMRASTERYQGYNMTQFYDSDDPRESWINARNPLPNVDADRPPEYDCSVCRCRVPYRDVAVGPDNRPRCPEHKETVVLR